MNHKEYDRQSPQIQQSESSKIIERLTKQTLSITQKTHEFANFLRTEKNLTPSRVNAFLARREEYSELAVHMHFLAALMEFDPSKLHWWKKEREDKIEAMLRHAKYRLSDWDYAYAELLYKNYKNEREKSL